MANTLQNSDWGIIINFNKSPSAHKSKLKLVQMQTPSKNYIEKISNNKLLNQEQAIIQEIGTHPER